MTRDQSIGAIKIAFATIGREAVMGWLIAQIPVLAHPFLRAVLNQFIDELMNFIVDGAETGVFFRYIDVRSTRQGRDFESSAFRNAVAQMSGTPEEKANAKKDLLEKFYAFAPLTT